MADLMLYVALTGFLIISELVYFLVAERLQIIDKPNQRSSHSKPTIRGAGIIFPFAILVWFGLQHLWPWFVTGTVLISIISFADDLNPIASWLRASIQALAVLLLFYQLSIFDWPVLLIVLAFIVSVGALNAFNFMDGINGITGLYALVNFGTFALINAYIVWFTDESLLIIIGLALFIFLFFNLRKTARCFAGDVGSVSLAFIQIFLMFQLIKATENLMWVGVFVVFGVDSVVTIIYRIKQKENIFEPHRQHVFQYLSNELKLSHTLVSLIYAVVQLIINCTIVYAYTNQLFWYVPVLIVVYLTSFVFVRVSVLRKMKLNLNK